MIFKVFICVCFVFSCINALTIRDIAQAIFGGLGGNYYPGGNGYYPPGGAGYPPGAGLPPGGVPGARPGCPLCDSSVYSYCSLKELHDACCCDSPGYSPFECRFTDCKYLHANSCDEYYLITNCCCVDVHRSLLNPFVTLQRRANN